MISPLALLMLAPQLAAPQFASCLKDVAPETRLEEISARYDFGTTDLLLPYLAVYAGKRIPGFNHFVQEPANARWEERFGAQEEALAVRFQELAMTMVRPSQLFGEAFSICGDVFCAALISHTVLRTLGRSETGFYTDPLTGEVHDENPKWFRDRPDFWKTAAAEIQGSLTPLRGDERGDGFGEWYHFFGVLTFSVHEMTLHGNLKEVVFAVKSGTFLNPILAGGKEDPVKVQLDHDSIAVSGIYLSGEAETGICAGAY